jgi:hypothetical protein
MKTVTVLFDELEIEAEVEFSAGCAGDQFTQPTEDRWTQTGKYGFNGIDISGAINAIDKATKGKVSDNFDLQING